MGVPLASYDIRRAKNRSTIRPPLLSLVFVGISGFCGSPALAITTSVRTLPAPQPANVAAASKAQTPSAAAVRIRCKPSSSDQQYTSGVAVTALAGAYLAYHLGDLTAMAGIPNQSGLLPGAGATVLPAATRKLTQTD